MRTIRAFMLGVGASASMLAVAFSAQAGPVRIATGGTVPSLTEAGYRQNLRALQRDALAQRQRDGGTLTAEHRADLQRRLERVNDLYQRTLDNNNPLLLNADGSRVRPAGAAKRDDWTYSPLLLVGTER